MYKILRALSRKTNNKKLLEIINDEDWRTLINAAIAFLAILGFVSLLLSERQYLLGCFRFGISVMIAVLTWLLIMNLIIPSREE